MNKQEWLDLQKEKQLGIGRTIEFADYTHRIEQLKGTHAYTACGISTFTDCHKLLKSNVPTCKKCQGVTWIQIIDNQVISVLDDKILYIADDFKLARQWCYQHGAMGFDVRFGVCLTKINYDTSDIVEMIE